MHLTTRILLVTFFISLCSFHPEERKSETMPFKRAGLTERQAAAHLLSRFTFGARPGDVDAVLKLGPDQWFEQQLKGNLNDDDLTRRLSPYDALGLTNAEVTRQYPRPVDVVRMAEQDGVIRKDEVDASDAQKYRSTLASYLKEKKIKPQRELFRQFTAQKIIRAAYSNNQLAEVLTDFWFNHFNVALSKRQCAPFVPAYERDVIRPGAIGNFGELLLATAKSPAMLLYLDNYQSAGSSENAPSNPRLNKVIERRLQERVGDSMATELVSKAAKARKSQGLNENYARELMELHTLGVDGGYTQKDVTEAARVLTGWTVFPFGDFPQSQNLRKMIEAAGQQNSPSSGLVHDGDFLFVGRRHDSNEKTVLGTRFAGGGYTEGVQLIRLLADHPSTARFISRKLAIRFVQDEPPVSLVNKMAETFQKTHGDIKSVLRTMVHSPEFWSPQAIRAKTKSPFEVAISAVRALNAEVTAPYQLYQWTEKMGQKMYFYQAPTGFPDRGQYWISTGALLQRMNFGMALANGEISGVRINLPELNQHHEPASAEDALFTFSRLIMPERKTDSSMKRLVPLLNDPSVRQRLNKAASSANTMEKRQDSPGDDDEDLFSTDDQHKEMKGAGSPVALAQVVGIILGSPEFQRR